jgi:hypothetical protein
MKKVVVWLSAVAGLGAVALSVWPVAGVGAVVLSTAACNGGGSCTYVSKCSGDVPSTADQVTLCENTLANANCGGYYSDYLGCYQSNQICLSNGTTDTMQSMAPCEDKYAKYVNCCFGGEGGTADSGFPQCSN